MVPLLEELTLKPWKGFPEVFVVPLVTAAVAHSVVVILEGWVGVEEPRMGRV